MAPDEVREAAEREMRGTASPIDLAILESDPVAWRQGLKDILASSKAMVERYNADPEYKERQGAGWYGRVRGFMRYTEAKLAELKPVVAEFNRKQSKERDHEDEIVRSLPLLAWAGTLIADKGAGAAWHDAFDAWCDARNLLAEGIEPPEQARAGS